MEQHYPHLLRKYIYWHSNYLPFSKILICPLFTAILTTVSIKYSEAPSFNHTLLILLVLHTGLNRTVWDHMGPYSVVWGLLGLYRTVQDHTGPYRTIQDHTGPYGTGPYMSQIAEELTFAVLSVTKLENSRCSWEFSKVSQEAKVAPFLSAWPSGATTMLIGHRGCLNNA